MKSQSSFAASMFRVIVGSIFVTMSVAFVSIPYSLSVTPGDSGAQVADNANRHLT